MRRLKHLILNRLLYVYPKRFLLWCYFKFIEKHPYLRSLLRDNLLVDLHYVTKNYRSDKPDEAVWREYALKHSGNWEPGKIDPFQAECLEPFIEKVEEEIKRKGHKTIADIGCANGYLLEKIVKSHTELNFMGLDFNTPPTPHSFAPITYIAGYPLETLFLRKNSISIDLAIASSTFFFILPQELHLYFQAFKELGIKQIAIFETNINGYVQKNDGKLWSKHMGYNYAWCHNYSGYMKAYGYKVTEFSRIKSNHPGRADHYLVTVVGEQKPAPPSKNS